MRGSASARRTGVGLPELITSWGFIKRAEGALFSSTLRLKKEPHHLRRGRFPPKTGVDFSCRPQPESGGQGLGLPSSGRHATKHSRYGPSRLRSDFAATYAAAAKRTFGEPSTPLFCIAAFRSSEPNHVRAFATSATSWRMTTSF